MTRGPAAPRTQFGEWLSVPDAPSYPSDSLCSYGFICEYDTPSQAPPEQHAHSFSATRIPPDCTKAGYTLRQCTCGQTVIDEVAQAGRAGLQAAAAKGIPVMIMEPLRGGKLVNMLPDAARKAMADSGRNWSPAEWGLRWLYNQPEVTVVLSGMNSTEMVEANCRTASEAQSGSLSEADLETLEKVKRAIREKEKVGCTGCRYCMPCPKGVDIPGIFRCWNAMYTESKSAGRTQFIQTVGLTREPAFASQCIRCGKCEQHCPQSIPIREKLQEADRALRPLPYKIAIQAARGFMFRKAAR